MDWAGVLGLDTALARQFPPGTLEDGLAGVRGMPSEEAKRAVEAFLEDARVRIYTALVEAKTVKGSTSAAEANGKFDGFQGSFATLKDFHAGAEATLQLGYPKAYKATNPFPFMERMSLENKDNFFEKRVSTYAKATVGKNREDMSFKMNEDF